MFETKTAQFHPRCWLMAVNFHESEIPRTAALSAENRALETQQVISYE